MEGLKLDQGYVSAASLTMASDWDSSEDERPKEPTPAVPSFISDVEADRHDGAAAVNLEKACAQVRADLIGRLGPVRTPFGCKPLVCEWKPSGGRALKVEKTGFRCDENLDGWPSMWREPWPPRLFYC